jgi:hypothetical protein
LTDGGPNDAKRPGIDRRTIIKRTAAAGAVAWTAPLIIGSVASPGRGHHVWWHVLPSPVRHEERNLQSRQRRSRRHVHGHEHELHDDDARRCGFGVRQCLHDRYELR